MPMPYADRMPQNLCTKTVRMPRDRAMAHACCGPAPPKAARTCDAVSKPLLSVISRIGRHIASFATRKVPQRHLLGRQRREFRLRRLGVYSLERLVDADRLLVERASRGVGAEGLVRKLSLKILGKYLGSTLPRTTFASVTDRDSPPLR